MTITRNAIRCLECDEVIESRYRHDWRSCSGGHVFVDGGLDYLRRGWHGEAETSFEELSECVEEGP